MTESGIYGCHRHLWRRHVWSKRHLKPVARMSAPARNPARPTPAAAPIPDFASLIRATCRTVNANDIYGDVSKRKGQNINNLSIDDRDRHLMDALSLMAASCLVGTSPQAGSPDDHASAKSGAVNQRGGVNRNDIYGETGKRKRQNINNLSIDDRDRHLCA